MRQWRVCPFPDETALVVQGREAGDHAIDLRGMVDVDGSVVPTAAVFDETFCLLDQGAVKVGACCSCARRSSVNAKRMVLCPLLLSTLCWPVPRMTSRMSPSDWP